jgi:hypothetical protein
MKKMVLCALALLNGSLFAETSSDMDFANEALAQVVQDIFVVNVSAEESDVIEELITTMSTTSTFGLAFKRRHLREIAKKLRPVSSTQFLGYVFERPFLIDHMKHILKSSTKWKGLTKSIVRGLKKEAEATTLFDDIPMFAAHTRGNPHVLDTLAKNQDYNGFIVHLLEQN